MIAPVVIRLHANRRLEALATVPSFIDSRNCDRVSSATSHTPKLLATVRTGSVQTFSHSCSRLTRVSSATSSCAPICAPRRFFATLKTELVHDARWATRAAARAALAAYLEGWYNRRRRHSTLDYLSPVEYELRLRAA